MQDAPLAGTASQLIFAETTHISTHIQPHPHYLPTKSTRNQDASPLPLPKSIHTSENNTKTFCNQYLKYFYPIPPTRSNHTHTHPYTLTIPIHQPYLKSQYNRNTTVKNIYVPPPITSRRNSRRPRELREASLRPRGES